MAKSRPNIIVFLADDMGYGDIGAFGHDAVQTPHLDRLAAEGVMLTQHYAGSCMCAPARAALLTGKYPHRTGSIDVSDSRGLDRIALREVTIADLFKSAGYATGLVGKWHNGAIGPEYHPRARGFDEFVGFRGGMVTSYWDWVIEFNGSFRGGDGRYLTDVFTEAALSFIDRHQQEPFCLYVPYNAPHSPLEAPEEDIEPFRELGKFTEAVCTLYGMNRRMDAGVGRILARLVQLGIDDNTLVLFTSDNGPMFGGTGEQSTHRYNAFFNGYKTHVLEGGIRVPAIVRWPAGLPAGCRIDAMTHFTDWLPALLGVAGEHVPGELDIDGTDILPILRGEDAQGPTKRFWQWNRYEPVANCNAAMRDGPWKLYRAPIPEAMRKAPGDTDKTFFLVNHPEEVADICRDPLPERELSPPRKPMLYNLDEDPCEQTDLADVYPGRATTMQQQLDRWFAQVEADRRSID